MKTVKEVAKKFHDNMQKIADNSDCTISVSTVIDGKRSEEKVIASPKKNRTQKALEYLKNENPTMDEISAAADNLIKQAKFEDRMSSMVLQVNKIKFDGDVVEINYNQIIEGADDIKVVLKSTDQPLPEFKAAINSLSIHVEEICCLPKGYCDLAEIRGVSLSYPKEIMGAVITALIPVTTANSPVCLNTPFLPSAQYNDGGTAPTLPFDCVLKINTLIELAENYINGERQQDDQLKMEL